MRRNSKNWSFILQNTKVSDFAFSSESPPPRKRARRFPDESPDKSSDRGHLQIFHTLIADDGKTNNGEYYSLDNEGVDDNEDNKDRTSDDAAKCSGFSGYTLYVVHRMLLQLSNLSFTENAP